MSKLTSHLLLFLLAIATIFPSCQSEGTSGQAAETPKTFHVRKMNTPMWVRNANIYQVDVRTYTEEGTFNAFRKHLQEIKDMGAKTISFRPIYPISITKRIGDFGNYDAVADFAKVNPELGTFEDFSGLVDEMHRMGMHVMLDWNANHTGWDHAWITTHPEWYTQKDGEISPALDVNGNSLNRSDVAELNYESGPMRNTMIELMKFWIRAASVDGFKCLMASNVPDDFWNEVRPALEQLKPVMMIADSEGNSSHFETCFQANGGQELYDILTRIANGRASVDDLDAYQAENDSKYPAGYFHLNYTVDAATIEEDGDAESRLGDASEAMSVLAYTLEGIPSLYGGQEKGMAKGLAKTSATGTDFAESPRSEFFSKLIQLKNYNKGIWNGNSGGLMERLNAGGNIYAFKREHLGNRVIVIVNCSDKDASTTLFESIYEMTDLFTEKEISVSPETPILLKPWQYLVLANPSIVL